MAAEEERRVDSELGVLRKELGFDRDLGVGTDLAEELRLPHRQELARTHALAHGICLVGTRDRLNALAEMGVLQAEDARDLLDAFDFISHVRLRHQARQVAKKGAPDNFVGPEELSSFEREHLRDAFVVVREAQERLSRDYGGGLY